MKYLPIFLILITATATATAQTRSLTATWNDNADNENEQWLESLDDQGLWTQIEGTVVDADIETVNFQFDSTTMLELRVVASNAFGEAYSDVLPAVKPVKPSRPNVIKQIGLGVSKLIRSMGRPIRRNRQS